MDNKRGKIIYYVTHKNLQGRLCRWLAPQPAKQSHIQAAFEHSRQRPLVFFVPLCIVVGTDLFAADVLRHVAQQLEVLRFFAGVEKLQNSHEHPPLVHLFVRTDFLRKEVERRYVRRVVLVYPPVDIRIPVLGRGQHANVEPELGGQPLGVGRVPKVSIKRLALRVSPMVFDLLVE